MKKLLCLLLCLLLVSGCTKNPEKRVSLKDATSIADLTGTKIAIQTDLHEELAKQILDVDYKFYDDFDMEATAVKSGAVDGAIMDEPAAISYCQKDPSFGYIKLVNNQNGFTVSEADYANAAAFKKGNPLRDQVEAIISAVDMSTYYSVMEDLLKILDGQTIEKFALKNESEVSSISGTLVVGMECCSEPFNWTDIDGPSFGSVYISKGTGAGQPCNGLDVQVAKYVASKLNYKLEIYALEWDSLLPALDSGVIDCVIGNMSPREDRKVNYDFTSSYYDVNYVVLFKK